MLQTINHDENSSCDVFDVSGSVYGRLPPRNTQKPRICGNFNFIL